MQQLKPKKSMDALKGCIEEQKIPFPLHLSLVKAEGKSFSLTPCTDSVAVKDRKSIFDY